MSGKDDTSNTNASTFGFETEEQYLELLQALRSQTADSATNWIAKRLDIFRIASKARAAWLFGRWGVKNPAVDAEDASQKMLEEFLQACGTDKSGWESLQYVAGVLRNICLSILRTDTKWRQAPAIWDEADARSDPAKEFSRDCAAKDLWECAVQLPPAQRQAIEACCFQQLSPAEAAAALGRPTSSIYVALHRARQRLNEKLQARGHEAWEFRGRSGEQRKNLSDPRKKSGPLHQ